MAGSRVPTASDAKSDEEDALHGFICPITQAVMKDPVLLVETGISYERAAIWDWIVTRKKNTDPATGRILKTKAICTNVALRQAIQDWEKRRKAQAKPAENKSEHKAESKAIPAPATPAPEIKAQKQSSSAFAVAKLRVEEHKFQPVEISREDMLAIQATLDEFDREERKSAGESKVEQVSPSQELPREESKEVDIQVRKEVMLEAVVKGDIDQVAYWILERGVDRKSKLIECGSNAVILATKHAKKEMLIYLCENLKISVNEHDKQGHSALYYAIDRGDEWFSRYLLNQGAYEFYLQDRNEVALYWKGKAKFPEWDQWKRPKFETDHTRMMRNVNAQIGHQSAADRAHQYFERLVARR